MISPLEPSRYASPSAFRAALEARLRDTAAGDPTRLNLMRVQFAIGRLLARMELARPGEWVTKGGTSLLARFDGRCRFSRDLDVQRKRLHDDGLASLTESVSIDAGDWIRYRVDRVKPLLQDEIDGLKARVVAVMENRDVAQFDLDMVEEDTVGGLVRCRPFLPIALVGVPMPDVLLYPVEDHVADKLSAMGKIRRYGDRTMASTRYRDLADLALLAVSVPVAAAPLLAALDAPARHWARDAFGETGLRLPGPEWPDGYAGTVRSEPFVVERWPTAAAALAAAKPMVDPALAGTVLGSWDPAAGTWRSSGVPATDR